MSIKHRFRLAFRSDPASRAKASRAADPCALPRACKNPVAIDGARRAHLRDGAALTRFLHWISTEGQSGQVDEIAAAIRLEEFRLATNALEDLSFDTISGAGPNGAVVHYKVSMETNRKLELGSLYLSIPAPNIAKAPPT